DEIRARARAGTAVLLVSTDLDEVLELGNRIGVLFRGRVFPVEDGERKRERIGQLMLGAGEGA
ncbi:MAG: heme ABC transporter ATP-binding protein, partial [Deltaproteobacteria bacterium]|nr:heme ABC transporter ATP-binding protein [Deltaproteobacteria bacterium]